MPQPCKTIIKMESCPSLVLVWASWLAAKAGNTFWSCEFSSISTGMRGAPGTETEKARAAAGLGQAEGDVPSWGFSSLPRCISWVLNTELQCLEVVGESVLSCALILVGVSGVATLFLAVPEEPVGAERGEHGHEMAPALLLHGSGHGQAPCAGTRKGQVLVSTASGRGQEQLT